jgi:hypothetical protein
MSTESLADRLARLERERLDADTRYNAALTALDQALGQVPELPHPPPGYDASRLPDLGARADVMVGGAPHIDRSLKGRLRGLVWRIVGPMFEQQRQFNATLVDHLARNVVVHGEVQKAVASTIGLARAEMDRVQRLHAHLIQYLQTITLYVDTKDRATAGGAEVLNAGLHAITS